VPHIYAHHVRVLEVYTLEFQLLKLGYPYEVIRDMPLPEARMKARVLGMVYG